jgi:hypothetical protein
VKHVLFLTYILILKAFSDQVFPSPLCLFIKKLFRIPKIYTSGWRKSSVLSGNTHLNCTKNMFSWMYISKVLLKVENIPRKCVCFSYFWFSMLLLIYKLLLKIGRPIFWTSNLRPYAATLYVLKISFFIMKWWVFLPKRSIQML